MAKRIGTHDGTFHCDEVLACWMLKQLPEYRNCDIVRTRKPEELAECDIVVDVGAVYNPATHRYDHHQKEFMETMNSLNGGPWTTKLSSAGLVYLHFGKPLLQQICNTTSSETLEILYSKMYESFVEEVDAVDNGINQYDGEARYKVTSQLGSRVGALNPRWNSKEKEQQPRFEQAMTLAGGEFLQKLDYFHASWLPARGIVEDAIKNRFQVDESGEILSLGDGGCPWKDHLMLIEQEMKLDPIIKFMLYTDQNGSWRVGTVPDLSKGAFAFRVGLLNAWRGLRDEKLTDISGIPGCVFVHTSGFIGGNKSYEGALEMARVSLQAHKLSAVES